MKKKGYTLIELIGVIVLLGLIVLVITTTSDKTIKKANTKTNKQCKENIITAAQNWVLDNKEKISTSTSLSVNTLIKEGYIDNKECSNIKCVIISKNTDNDKAVYGYSTSTNSC